MVMPCFTLFLCPWLCPHTAKILAPPMGGSCLYPRGYTCTVLYSKLMSVVPGGYGKWLRQSVDELDGLVVLSADFIDEEVQQRQPRLVGTRVYQLRQ